MKVPFCDAAARCKMQASTMEFKMRLDTFAMMGRASILLMLTPGQAQALLNPGVPREDPEMRLRS